MNIPKKSDTEGEIDFSAIISLIFAERKTLFKASIFSGLLSIFIALSLSNYYKSTAILEIYDSSSSMSSLGQYGDLASVVGISLPSDTQSKSTRVMETIKSRDFITHLILKENIVPSLMAADKYDDKSEKIIFDSSKYDEQNDQWKNTFFSRSEPKPTNLDVHRKYIKDIMTISNDRRSGLIFISVEHLSPVFAKEFLELIINEANSLLRENDLKESSDALIYLESELSKTSLIEIKDSLNKLIQSQLETQMLAKISNDYVLKAIESPYLPEKKSKPSRAIICIVITLSGFLFTTMWVLVRHFLIEDKT
tara:strand:+ start:1328 stop:2254 length:927 start_codon:yes stop_codon:yes gene_type:complete